MILIYNGSCMATYNPSQKPSKLDFNFRWKLYSQLPPISKTIQISQRRHAGHCWRNKDGLISNVLPCIPSRGRASIGRHAKTYLQQLFTDTGCSLEDLLRAMDDREKWGERVREICASGIP